jgi:HEAT repeat protein
MTEAEAKALLPELSSSDANKRLDATLKLGVPGWSFAVKDLCRLAKSDPDYRVRIAAIRVLSTIGDRAAYPTLQSIWQDSSQRADVRDEALRACDHMDGLEDTGDDDKSSGPSTPREDPKFRL